MLILNNKNVWKIILFWFSTKHIIVNFSTLLVKIYCLNLLSKEKLYEIHFWCKLYKKFWAYIFLLIFALKNIYSQAIAICNKDIQTSNLFRLKFGEQMKTIFDAKELILCQTAICRSQSLPLLFHTITKSKALYRSLHSC